MNTKLDLKDRIRLLTLMILAVIGVEIPIMLAGQHFGVDETSPILFAIADAVCVALVVGAVAWHLAIEPLKHAKERIDKLAIVASHCQHGVVIADAEGRVEWTNEAFEHITGFASDEVIGQKAGVFLHGPETDRSIVELVRERLAARQAVAVEIINYAKNGRRFWNSLRISPVYDDRGDVIHFVGTQTDITQQKLADLELRRSELKFRALFESTTDAVLLLDQNGFIDCNAAALSLFGCCSREDFCSKHPADFSPRQQPCGTDSSLMAKDQLATAFALGQHQFEWMHLRVDTGATFAATVSLSRVELEGRPILQAVVHDISEQKRAEALMLSARQAAERASQDKSAFLATMSHEMRTPLNGILGMNELLLRTDLDERQRRFAEACSASGKLLLQLINDILDLSKIEAGKLELDPRECNVEAFLYDAADILSPVAQQKGLALTCRLTARACVIGVFDDNRLRQVVVNLVANALKFTASGGVTIAGDLRLPPEGTARLRVEVTDTGIGIPEERRERLFKAFSQVDSSTTRRFGGSGLGLSICHQLIGLMGGEIGVTSQVGVGSTFWFEVPLTVVTDDSACRRLQQSLSGTRVIAVDGLDRERRQIGECLASWGCSVLQVSTIAEAIDAINRTAAMGDRYAVLLVDCRLAPREEYVLLHQLAMNLDLHVIGLAPLQDNVTTDYLHALGLKHVLRDPIRPSMLLNAMTSVLSAEGKTRTFDRASEDSAKSPPSAVPLSGHVLLAEDNRINQMYIVELLKLLGCKCDVAANGDEALSSAAKQRYDLVLMDCQMPEMDGFTAAHEIRKREAAGQQPGRLPIVALTANALKGDRERCLQAGMDEYVSKPVESEQLKAVLAKYLSHNR